MRSSLLMSSFAEKFNIAFYFQSRPNPGTAALNQTGEKVVAFIGDLSASATASGQVEAVQTAKRENLLLVPNAATHPDRQNGTYSVSLVLRSVICSQFLVICAACFIFLKAYSL